MRAIKGKRLQGKHSHVIILLIALLLLAGYLYNLTGWQIYDDEGEYLYQVWRMTLGALPYRDFLTPQLPLYLYASTAVMRVGGGSLLAMRLYSVVLAFASAFLLYLAGRHHAGSAVGVLALVLFLLHPDVFRETRIFRNEPLFLLLVTAGLVVATWSKDGPERRQLAAAGLLFGLATLVKLFGLLPAGGVGLWLIWLWLKRRHSFADFVKNGLALALPIALVLLLVAGAFSLAIPDFLELVLGHHLAQGSNLTFVQIVQNKLKLYAEYLRFYPALIAVATLSAILGLVRDDARQRWAWQLPPVLAFFALSRELGQRHFMFVLPALSLLAAWLLWAALSGRYRRWGRLLGLLILAAFLVPSLRADAYRASWVDTETAPVVELIKEKTAPGDHILADDIGLAFYARRPTTYSGAALSHGAVTSGQITGEALIEEVVHDDVRMVLVDTSLLTGNHLVFLPDFPRFQRFLRNNYTHLGNFRRDYQEIDVWWRERKSPFMTNDPLTIEYEDGTHFGESMVLLGYTMTPEALRPGETLDLTLYWTASAPADHYWSVFVHLVAEDGTLVGQHDKVPYGGLYPPNRWQPGQIVDDRYQLTVAADAAPGQYQIVLGMYDWQSGDRLPLHSVQGTPLPNDQVQLGKTVTVLP